MLIKTFYFITKILSPYLKKNCKLNGAEKLLYIRGGTFTKNHSNSSLTETQVSENLFENKEIDLESINKLNRAYVKPKSITYNISNKTTHSLKDKLVSQLKPEVTNTSTLKPEIVDQATNLKLNGIDTSDFKPSYISSWAYKTKQTPGMFTHDDFGHISNEMEINREKFIKYIIERKMEHHNRIKAMENLSRKLQTKTHIKQFVRQNTFTKNRIKFITLPLSNKEIFKDFILENKDIIKYISYFLNYSLLFISLYFFKLTIIKNFNIIYRQSINKDFKDCIKPTAKISIILLSFSLILHFGPRTIETIMLKLSYVAFCCYKLIKD